MSSEQMVFDYQNLGGMEDQAYPKSKFWGVLNRKDGKFPRNVFNVARWTKDLEATCWSKQRSRKRWLALLCIAAALLNVAAIMTAAWVFRPEPDLPELSLHAVVPRSALDNRSVLPFFVASRSLALLCHIKPNHLLPLPASEEVMMEEYLAQVPDMQPGMSVYVRIYHLMTFMERVYPELLRQNKRGLILVTGDGITSAPLQALQEAPEKQQQLEQDGVFRVWFAQNIDVPQTAFYRALPLGIDYHTQAAGTDWGTRMLPLSQENALLRIQRQAKPFSQRSRMILMDAHLTSNSNPADRTAMADALLGKPFVHALSGRLPRQEFWQKASEFQFVGSPLGRGLDCHRTWEALALGCVPIIRKTTLSPLFDDLPVLQVDSYEDITEEMLDSAAAAAAAAFQNQAVIDKLMSLQYWDEMIHGDAAA